MISAELEQHLGLMALGFITGAYGTLIGAGGGFVLMPILLLLYPNEGQQYLTSISLAVVFFNALSGSGAYARMKRIDYKSGAILAAATIPGAIIGALHTSAIPRSLFDTIFGIVLISISVIMIFRPRSREAIKQIIIEKRSRWRVTRRVSEASGTHHTYSYNILYGVVLSFLVGYVSSFLGIGGGIIHVPALTYVLNFPIHISTATSHFILAIMALAGTLVHIYTGTFSHGVHRTIYLAIGVVLGAQLGARLSSVMKGKWILRGLAAALALLGIRILYAVFSGGI